MSLIEGAVVGNYRILGKLGEGGMGAVYRAVDTMIQREVAVKALRPEIASQPDVLDRFRSEAVLLAKLNNPAIAQLYAFFSEGGQFYMVMEYVAGDTFERVIQQQGAMEWPRAFGYLSQILEGIGHAHAAGILHRDLKPANVMLTPAGKIKLMDFGIAQALGAARMTRQGRIIGTLEYLAPERIQGKPADARSDLYSVGVMLYEMLSGRLPFHSDSEYELLQQQIQKAPPELSGFGVHVPAEVEAVVRTALEKEPERRYADAEEFSAALAALLPTRRTASRVVAMAAAAPVAAPVQVAAAAVAAAAVAPAPAPVAAGAPVAAAASQFESLMAKPIFWLASAGALVVLALGIVFATLRSHQPAPVTMADAGQPQMYQPPRSSSSLPMDIVPSAKEPGSTPPAAQTPTSQTPAPQTPAPQTPAPQTPAPQAPTARTPTAQTPTNRDAQPAPKSTRTAAKEAPPVQTAAVTRPVQPSSPPSVPAPAPAPAPAQVPAPAPTAVVEQPSAIPTPSAPLARTPVTGGLVRLSDARSIFVAGSEGELDTYVREEIQKQLGGRVRLAASLADADAVMRITLDEQKGKGVAQAGRIFGVKDHATVRAVIFDAHTSHVIWQQGAGDRKPIIGSFHGDPLKRLAERIVKEMRESYGR